MAAITTLILKGDYARKDDVQPERQATAQREGCVATVEFHFNSATPDAKGAEVLYKPDDPRSREFAKLVWGHIARTGLPVHGSAAVRRANMRSLFIRHYAAPAILLEPLFVSSPTQAAWLHDPAHFEALARAVTDGIREFVGAGLVGLSPGHAYKTGSPNDPGAACVKGDTERAHVLALVARIEAMLAET